MRSAQWVLFVISGWLTGCSSLKPVTTFTSQAAVNLQQGLTLPVTFTDTYRQRLLNDSLDRHPFGRVSGIGIDFADRLQQPLLSTYRRADSLLQNANAVLNAYFQAVSALSANGTVSTTAIQSTAFDAYLQGSPLNLTADQTESFDRLANLTASGALNRYRRRKLKALLERTAYDVPRALTVVALAYQRLAAVVDISRSQRYGSYKTQLLKDSKLTYSQKRELAQQWLATAREIDRTRQALLSQSQAADAVKLGFLQLYAHRDHLTGSALATSLAPFLTKLQQVQADLTKLTPTYGTAKR